MVAFGGGPAPSVHWRPELDGPRASGIESDRKRQSACDGVSQKGMAHTACGRWYGAGARGPNAGEMKFK